MKLFFNFFYLFIIGGLLISCSETEPSAIEPENDDLLVQNLYEHSKEFTQNVYSYKNGIHAAVGFGIANSFMVEGDNSNIIIDATDSVYQAEKVYAKFQAINSNPISAIIYTHNHGDHTFGARYFVEQQLDAPLIIAHDSTAKAVEKVFGLLNPIISLRTSKMFGTQLLESEVVNVGIGPFLSTGKSAPGYMKPTLTFEDELKINLSGIAFELYHAPGETDDQLFVWLPEFQALFPGDNLYKTFPNLYTIRGTSHRNVQSWVRSLDHMISFQPQYLYPSHTLPLSGSDVSEVLTLYRDGIQFVHDQTIRLMNLGYYPEEIIERITLPNNISSSPFFDEFYGTLRWSVRSIFNGYLGWFSGNISELDPTPMIKKAELLSEMIGGSDNLFYQLEKAINNEEMQWALELSDLLLALDYKTKEVTTLRAKAAYFIGRMSSNPNKRNYFLSEAQILMEGGGESLNIKPKPSMLGEIPIDMFFEVLSVRLNPANFEESELINACFIFSSGVIKTITVRNQIAHVTDKISSNCDFKISTSEETLKQVLAGLRNPVTAITNQDIEVEKKVEFIKFLAKFRP
ncbi:MBL fold metallo-hydrolase [Gammaproteobacteria bacterium]|nr:MBL fold metallo-hydrolase [Gammaproteobacteria bacterium]|tara:strand:- start:2441 stop:4159 length:1719 start_codon:yes stop_codon:yes gene_type:complete